MSVESLREIVDHYERTREAERLFQGPGVLERVRTEEIVSRYLRAPPARVLDVGGGPGTHALWLLRQGYEVDLIDPVGVHVEEAAKRFQDQGLPGTATLGDARSLGVGDEIYDAVLLLGPLYHLTERTDRVEALAQTGRVLRRDGFGFVAAISRFASLLDGFSRGFIRDPDFVRILERDLVDGQHRNVGPLDYFTTAFFHRPEELAEEIREAGLELEALLGVEGPFWCMGGFQGLWADPSTRSLMLEMLRRTELEPSLLGASAHWLAVVRRPGFIVE